MSSDQELQTKVHMPLIVNLRVSRGALRLSEKLIRKKKLR